MTSARVDVAFPFLGMSFEEYTRTEGVRLRGALVASFGHDTGLDAYAEACSYGWQHWERIAGMANPTGYLYQVGRNHARRRRRTAELFPAPPPEELPAFEPRLLPALAALAEQQRTAVVLVHGFGWSMADVARLLDVSHSTVRTHVARALAHLHAALEVTHADRG